MTSTPANNGMSSERIHEIAVETLAEVLCQDEVFRASGRDPLEEAHRIDSSIRAEQKLRIKRQKRNLYMRGYRCHLKSLPTWSALNRYRGSTLKYLSKNGSSRSAMLTAYANNLIVTCNDDGMFLETVHVLDADPKLARKFVKSTILLSYESL